MAQLRMRDFIMRVLLARSDLRMRDYIAKLYFMRQENEKFLQLHSSSPFTPVSNLNDSEKSGRNSLYRDDGGGIG